MNITAHWNIDYKNKICKCGDMSVANQLASINLQG